MSNAPVSASGRLDGQHPSLIQRLIAWQALALVLAWLALAGLLTWRGVGEVQTRLQGMSTVMASAALSPEYELPQRMASTEGAAMALQGLDEEFAQGLRPAYQLWDHEGRLIYRSANAPPTRLDAASAFGETLNWQVQRSEPGLGRTLLIAAPRELAPSAMLPLLWQVLTSQLGVFLWHGLVIWLSVRVGLRPLAQLAERIAQRRAGDLAPVQVDRLYAETAPVLRELNELLAHEAQRLDKERRFLADAAHELRTPLAAVNAQAHLLLSEADAQARGEAAAALTQGIARVSHLLAQLLTLARAEASPTKPEPIELDAASLLRGRVALLAGLARPRGIELSLNAPEHLPFRLEPEGFCSIADNLIDNAIRYTAPGGRVEVSLSRQGDVLAFGVRDNGRGIAPELRERVFERFYRVPGSAEQGTGLGLAIVKRVAERDGATLSFVAGLDGRGLGLRLLIPSQQGKAAGAGQQG
ncbi:sensor histidine kinase [Roseateles sp. PN1]|uniref:sensor histidine kinase n=1 Tax=Roseateles sp. PN1 TaxID=3137372 RepID=UPI003139D76D